MGNRDGQDTERFVARQNIGRYERLLVREADPAAREQLALRLAETRAQLFRLEIVHATPIAPALAE